MAILKNNVLKQIITNVPDEFIIEFDDGTTIVPITDKVEIDVGNKRVIFKKIKDDVACYIITLILLM